MDTNKHRIYRVRAGETAEEILKRTARKLRLQLMHDLILDKINA